MDEVEEVKRHIDEIKPLLEKVSRYRVRRCAAMLRLIENDLRKGKAKVIRRRPSKPRFLAKDKPLNVRQAAILRLSAGHPGWSKKELSDCLVAELGGTPGRWRQAIGRLESRKLLVNDVVDTQRSTAMMVTETGRQRLAEYDVGNGTADRD